jgi:ribosomal protein S12 methylthiotransferase accessory factor
MFEDIIRKDNTADNSKILLQELFTKIGIKIKKIGEYKFSNSWYSCRYEFEDLPGKGTNGKGLTDCLSEVSGMAEMMERIQSGVLIDKSFSFMNNKKILFPDEKYKKFDSSNQFNKYIFISKKNNYNYLIKNNINYRYAPFINIIKERIEYLPIELIELSCGSNGLCAGNSFHEAITQGICEVFERKVLNEIYNMRNNFYVYDEKCLYNYDSFNLIKKLKSIGFECRVIDCSFNGTIPVVGLLIINNTKNKYKFALGSDPNFNIALQRCVTEIFQGIEYKKIKESLIDVNYNLFDKYNIMIDYKKYNNYAFKEYFKCITYGGGNIPYYMFSLPQKNKISGFMAYNNNYDTFNYLITIIKNLNLDIFIRNYSYLGFNTYRVYIPSYSEVFKINDNYFFFKKNIESIKLCSERNINFVYLKKVIRRLKEQPTYNGMYSSIFNIIVDNTFNNESIIDKLFLSYKDNNYKYKKIEKYLANEIFINSDKYNQTILAAMIKILVNIKYYNNSKIMTSLNGLHRIDVICKENIMELLNDFIKIPSCPNCNVCPLNKCCFYERWIKIMGILDNHKNKSFPDQTLMLNNI